MAGGGWQGTPVGRVCASKARHLDEIGVPSGDRPSPVFWTIEDEGSRPLTVNRVAKIGRRGWASHTADTRLRWFYLAKAAKVPHLRRVSITVEPMAKDRRSPQDPAACAPEVKAAIDGLVDAGILDDDTGDIVLEVTFLPMIVEGRDGLRITLRDEGDRT